MTPQEAKTQGDDLFARFTVLAPQVLELVRATRALERTIEHEPWAYDENDESTPARETVDLDRLYAGAYAIARPAEDWTGSSNANPAWLAFHGFVTLDACVGDAR